MKSVPSQEIAHLGGLGLERTVSAGASVAVERQREGITQGYAETAPKFAPVVGSQPSRQQSNPRGQVLFLQRGPILRRGALTGPARTTS